MSRGKANIEVTARSAAYQAELAKLPDITSKEALKAAMQLEKQLTAAQQRAAKEAARAAKKAAEGWKQSARIKALDMLGDLARDAAAAIKDMVVESVALRREIVELAEDTQLSTSTMAAMELAARRGGVEFAEIADGVRDFGEAMFDITEGGGKAEETFRDLGIEVQNADGSFRDVDAVFKETITKLQGVEDGARRTAYAQQLMSDNGAELLRVLDGHSLDDYAEAAERFGLAMGPEQVDAQQKFADATRGLGVAVEDAIAGLTEWLDYSTIADWIAGFTRGFVAVKAFLGTWITEVGGALVGYGKAIMTLWKSPNEAMGILSESSARMVGSLKTAGAEMFSEVNAWNKLMSEGLPDLFEPVTQGAKQSAEGLREAKAAARELAKAMKDLGAIEEGLTRARVTEAERRAMDHQAELDRITELGERTGAFEKAEELRREAARQFHEEEAEHRRDAADAFMETLRQQRDAEKKAAHDRTTDSEERVASEEEAAGAFAGLWGGAFDAIAGMHDQSTERGKKATRDWLVASKTAAATDVAIKQVQAVAAAWTLGPIAGAGASIAMLATFGKLAAEIKGMAMPSRHTGGMAADEFPHMLKRHEFVVDAPTVARAGGEQGVREKLEAPSGTSGGGTVLLVDLGAERIQAPLVRRLVDYLPGKIGGWNGAGATAQ